ncbi:hypothetical protein NPIL_488371 [Nephila pilipes]|uniref:Uncharacterized protein n=1 Tax=Nephila pilipes TaxID=299642 RepID=A0A8X6P1T3_NEPPI|nr:hypothetical protein NPIL_488371 [Nephila pilipes]
MINRPEILLSGANICAMQSEPLDYGTLIAGATGINGISEKTVTENRDVRLIFVRVPPEMIQDESSADGRRVVTKCGIESFKPIIRLVLLQ